jgi:outer membrane biosynthesis protein TonB
MPLRKALMGAAAVAAVIAISGTANLEAQEPTTPADTVPVTTPTEPVTPTPPTDPAPPPMPEVVEPAPPAAPTAAPTTTMTMEPATTPVNLQNVVVPPQTVGPMTVGNFNAAVNNQASHLRRLRGLSNLTGSQITLIPVSKLSPSPATAGIENAVTRAEGRAASARTAAAENAAVSAALTAAGVSADAVLAIAVRGHNENDVTVYHR